MAIIDPFNLVDSTLDDTVEAETSKIELEETDSEFPETEVSEIDVIEDLSESKVELTAQLREESPDVQEKTSEEKESKPVKIDPKYIGKKMSRNEPCFCGSGKKFKHCCGAL